jgi:hypothetical protein
MQIKFTLLTIAILLASSATFAQKKLTDAQKAKKQIYSGFVVLSSNNDTIHGDIQFINPTYNEEVVIFFDESGEKIKYYPKQGTISEYAFQYQRYNKQTEQLEPHWFSYVRKLVPRTATAGTKEIFLQREVKGSITLYNYYKLETRGINRRDYKHNYFVEKDGPDGYAVTPITRENYRSVIKELVVEGNIDLEMNLGTSGFGYKYLATLVNIQNAWLGGDVMYLSMLENAGVPNRKYTETND